MIPPTATGAATVNPDSSTPTHARLGFCRHSAHKTAARMRLVVVRRRLRKSRVS
jgi:hypothetical protein